MIIFSDIVTKDEILSDAYPLFNYKGDAPVNSDDWANSPAIFYVDTSMVLVGGDAEVDVGCGNAFGGDAEDEEEKLEESGAEKVINIVHHHNLLEVNFSKAEFKAFFKEYLKKLKAAVKGDDVATARLRDHVADITAFMGDIVKNFKDYNFYTGFKGNPDGLIIPGLYIGEAVAPRLFYLSDACVAEKC